MMSSFEDLGLHPQLVQTVGQLGFEQPTPIQQAAIPVLLAGRNVVGQAQTGTGKTAAFVLPLLQQIHPGRGTVQALVLTPTRELAIQVAQATAQMARQTRTRVLAVYGGQSYQIQTRQLERGVEVVVGTPGRLLDLIRQERLSLSQVNYLVLDEADEMLEMGFIEDVETILSQIPDQRQIALFSATMPEVVRRLADRYLADPQEININPTRRTVAETEQRFCWVREEQKLAALSRWLEVEDVKSALIFTRTKARAQEVADELTRGGYPAEALHGDLNQARREFVLNRFRDQAVKLLVATDVAARGLDIEEVSHVINLDAPADGEDYIHRIGRTGRAGRKGIALSFFCPRERGRLRQIEASTRQPIKEFSVPTREAVMAQRDECFLERLAGQFAGPGLERERALVERLMQAGQGDPVEIAAAAIRLARAAEIELPVAEITVPAAKPHTERFSRRGFERSLNEQNGAPAYKHAQGELHPSRSGKNKGHQEIGMVRLKMNLGEAHGLRPSDVVGAIAGEVGIPGGAIGEIDIRKNFTLVDISERHVRQVLNESSGKYFLRGKAVMLQLAN